MIPVNLTEIQTRYPQNIKQHSQTLGHSVCHIVVTGFCLPSASQVLNRIIAISKSRSV